MVCAAAETAGRALPLGSLTIPCRLTLAEALPLLTTVVVTFTVAAVVVGAGVLT